jgi:putative nucleotidyltransferase with HDIG domain
LNYRALITAAFLFVSIDETRERAWKALSSAMHDPGHLKHSLAVEAMMRDMAPANERDLWGLAGLLHDIDIERMPGDLSKHGIVGAQMIRDLGIDDSVVHAVSAHDDRAGIPRTSRMDHALNCADRVYWMVRSKGTASAGLTRECSAAGFAVGDVAKLLEMRL